MRGLIVACLCLALAASCAQGSAVGSCSTYSGTGAITFLRDDRNCSIYYECMSLTPTKMECPSTLHFNMVLKVCDWPAAAGCSVATQAPVLSTIYTRPTGSPQGQKATPAPESNEAAPVRTTVYTRAPSSTEAAPVKPIHVPPVEPATCPSVGACPKYNGDDTLIIQLPHAFNCSRFCKCDHGVPVTFECPSGLYYNKFAGYCDWPYNVQCLPDRGFAATLSSTPSSADSSVPAEPSRRRRSWNFLRH